MKAQCRCRERNDEFAGHVYPFICLDLVCIVRAPKPPRCTRRRPFLPVCLPGVGALSARDRRPYGAGAVAAPAAAELVSSGTSPGLLPPPCKPPDETRAARWPCRLPWGALPLSLPSPPATRRFPQARFTARRAARWRLPRCVERRLAVVVTKDDDRRQSCCSTHDHTKSPARQEVETSAAGEEGAGVSVTSAAGGDDAGGFCNLRSSRG